MNGEWKMNIHFNQLVSHVTILVKRVLDTYEIQDLQNIVTACSEPNKVSEAKVNTLLAAMGRDGQKIEAIKAYRVLTGLGLKESKDAVEKYWE